MRAMLLIIASIIGAFILIIALEVFIATLGKNEVYKNPAHTPTTFGSTGPEIKYLVMGDSTAAGQGAAYTSGFAVRTAQYLGQTHKVTMINTGVSGAKVHGVLTDQVPFAEEFKPDIVTIAMGANDTVRLTSLGAVKSDTAQVLDRIIKANCNVKIVLTGSPDMGTILRFYPPLKWIATIRSQQVTTVMKAVIKDKQVTYAPIFEEVGPPFYKDHTLFAEDRYHPNERGYGVWTTVIDKSLDESLANQSSHCPK